MRPSGASAIASVSNRYQHLILAGAVILAATVVLVYLGIRATVYQSVTEIAPPPAVALAAAASATTSGAYPARISIPKIAVNAAIQDRGLVAGNRMAAPTSFTEVGWYEYGAVPGQVGTAVLYAHLDNGLGLNGVFKNLDQLSIGDEVDITTASGTPERFIVNDIETYPYQDVPPAALGEGPSDGKAHITLLTCAGNPTEDPVEGYTYDHRLVVYATLFTPS